MKSEVLIALDTSTTSTGWAMFKNGILTQAGIIDLKSIKNTSERLERMVTEIYSLLSVYMANTVVIETPVVVRNPQVQRLLTMLYGAVYGKCVDANILFNDLRPTEWRKLIDPGQKPRKREELKAWGLKKVQELFNISNISDDMSDAILIGQAYLNRVNDEKEKVK